MGAYKKIILNFVEVFISSHGFPNILIYEYVPVVGLPTSFADAFFCVSTLWKDLFRVYFTKMEVLYFSMIGGIKYLSLFSNSNYFAF